MTAASVQWLMSDASRFRGAIVWFDMRGKAERLGRCLGCLSLLIQLVEFGFHGGVTAGEFFDGDVLSLVVGETEVAVGAEEGVFGLLQVGDRLVDFIDRGLELFAGEVVVAGKPGLEGVQRLK